MPEEHPRIPALLLAWVGRRCGSGPWSATLLWWLLAGHAGCAHGSIPAQEPFSPRASTSAHSVTADTSPDETQAQHTGSRGGWEVVVAQETGLAFPLPDAAGWVVQGSGRWWRARHAPTSSELLVRTWKARRSSTPQTCERQARLWKPDLPVPSSESVLEQRRLETPPGYLTAVTVSVGLGSGSSMLAGHVAAFGAAVGGCLAVLYVTEASGPSADVTLGTRLAVFVDRVLPAIQRLRIDDRARAAQTQAR
jgi:hypothetical protein